MVFAVAIWGIRVFDLSPRTEFKTWGQQLALDPLPIPAGSELLPFGIHTANSRQVAIRDVTVRIEGSPDANLIPFDAPHGKSELTIPDDGKPTYALRFPDPLTISAERSVFLGIRYKAPKSNKPFSLTFEAVAQVHGWDGLPWSAMGLEPFEKKIRKTIRVVPNDYDPKHKINEYFIKTETPHFCFYGEAAKYMGVNARPNECRPMEMKSVAL